MNNILLTGGTGFLGKPTVEKLVQIYPDKEFFIISREKIDSKFKNLQYIHADLQDKQSLESAQSDIMQCDTLIVMAALIPSASTQEESVKKFEAYMGTNVFAHGTLMSFISDNIKRIILTSTIDVYGVFEGHVTEQSATEPTTYYGVSKLAAEKFFTVYCKKKDIDLTILRLGQIYGPGDALVKVIPIFIKNILVGLPISLYGDGNDSRTFLYVDDAVQAICQALQKNIGGVFNIAGEEDVSINALVQYLVDVAKKDVEIEQKDSHILGKKMCMDITKAKKELGFFPCVSIKEGLQKILEYYES